MNENRSGHLTEAEISRWLVEGRVEEPAREEHVRDCAACQASMADAGSPLAAFRTAFIGWSEAQAVSPVPAANRAEATPGPAWGFWLPTGGLALATLMLTFSLIGSGTLKGHSAGNQAAGISSPAPVSDAALMDQVDTEVSEAVPDAMAPLTDLVSWDSAEQGSSEEKRTVRKKPSLAAKARPHAAD